MLFAEAFAVVADDTDVIRESLARGLRESHLTVFPASSGAEAIACVTDAKGRVEVAVLDLMMDDDGMSTAEAIQSTHPDVAIIFLTGFDSPEFRQLAVERRIRVVAWIDKDAHWLERTVSTVLTVIRERRLATVHREVREWARSEGLDAVKAQHLLDRVEPQFERLFLPRAVVQVSQAAPGEHEAWSPTEPTGPSDWPFGEVISRSRLLYEDVLASFDDVADRELAWQSFRSFLRDKLWIAVDVAGIEPERQQLADQLERGVEQLDSHQLIEPTLNAIAVSLQRLSSSVVRVADVQFCERLWRQGDVETLPSFADLLRDWQTVYGTDSVDGEEE